MDFSDKLSELRLRVDRQRSSVSTEEAAKTAFVLPFMQVLGYDIFNPAEVVPELTADHGVKKGEKVDYAIKHDEKIVILVECKKIGADLEAKHAGQLFRYFAVTDARFALLTDGVRYVFFADLEKPNRMDERPFFEFNILEYRDRDVDELKKFAKHTFDLQTILDTAANLKYHKALMVEIEKEFSEPSDELVRLLSSRVYSGRFTGQVKAQFETLTSRALKDFVRERINDRLKSALDGDQSPKVEDGPVLDMANSDDNGIVTTEEELEAYRIVQAIGSEVVEPSRIAIRDAKRYCAVLLDDNNRRPICRFHFGSKRLAVSIFKEDGESRADIRSVNEIYRHKGDILDAIRQYDQSTVALAVEAQSESTSI